MHIRLALFLQRFNFVFKYKMGKQNIVVDALSRQAHVLSVAREKILSFEELKTLYEADKDFKENWQNCVDKDFKGDYHIYDGYLFKVPDCSSQELPLGNC